MKVRIPRLIVVVACLCGLWALSYQRGHAMEGGPLSVPTNAWEVEQGDAFIADTKNNMGYLIHRSGVYTSFRIATGQRRVVRYIGRTYNAATPVREWLALSSEVKGDHTTFGKEGKFLRLYSADRERTAYGIHTHASIDAMLSETDRFRSMGCILVSDDVLRIVEETLKTNNESLRVTTVYGEPTLSTVATEETTISW